MRKKILILGFVLNLILQACGSTNIVNDLVDDDSSDTILSITPNEVIAVDRLIYSALNDKQKELYDTLLNCYKNFDTQIEIFATEDDVKIAHKAIIADNPDLFYVNGYVTDANMGVLFKTSKSFQLYPNYICSKEDYENYLATVDAKCNKILAGIDANASDYDKSKFVFEQIIDMTKYTADAENAQNMLSVFLAGKAVCNGYSQSYSYLMHKLNIPCAMITGQLQGVAHTWNIAVLDNDFYISDLTSGDSSYVYNDEKFDYCDYSYLNIDPSFLPEYMMSSMFSNFIMTATDNNYFYKENLFVNS